MVDDVGAPNSRRMRPRSIAAPASGAATNTTTMTDGTIGHPSGTLSAQ